MQRMKKCSVYRKAMSTFDFPAILAYYLASQIHFEGNAEMQKRRKKWVSKAKDFTFLCDILNKIWYIFLSHKISCWYMLYYIDMSASGGRKTFCPTRRSYKRCSEIVCFDVIEKRFFAKYINLAKFLKYWIPERIFKTSHRAPVGNDIEIASRIYRIIDVTCAEL